jgi:hypothetical protein
VRARLGPAATCEPGQSWPHVQGPCLMPSCVHGALHHPFFSLFCLFS